MIFWISTVGGMERGVDAEHDFLMADGVVVAFAIWTLMEVPEVSSQILSYFCHGDRCIDVNTVGMSHMDHDDRRCGWRSARSPICHGRENGG